MRTKVVHIVTRLDFGGAQQNTLHTVEHLDPKRFETILVCGPGGRLDARARAFAKSATGIRVKFIEDLCREISPLCDLAAYFQIYKFLKEERPAIVHTHSSKAGILGRIAARLAGVPVILHTFHGFAFHEYMPSALRAFYVFHERIAARFCKRLIFVSRANMEYARAYGIGSPENYVLIRSGIHLTHYPADITSVHEIRKSAGLPAEKPLVLSIGNLKPQKNCIDFIRTADAAVRRGVDASFAFIGDGYLREQCRQEISDRGLTQNIFLLGWREDSAKLLAASDIFLLTSLWEGLPRALVEAMKSGLPCVAYAVDGVQDVLKNGANGYAVSPGDWRTAAEHVCELIKNSGRRKDLGKAAAQSIGSEFDIHEMVLRQEELYAQLAP